MKFRSFLITIFVGVLANYALAITSTETLPEGIDSPSLRFGYIQGIDQKYTENGELMKLGDYKSIVFDAKTLAQFNSDAKKLVDALNRFGGYGMGDAFNLGVLRVGTEPTVNYFAPVYARGVTKRWTVGVGVPIINYKNRISLGQDLSNIEYYRSQFSGINAELDAALNTNLAQAARDTLAAKGYKPLNNRDEQFVGDVQLVSMYKLYSDADQALVYQAQFALPTGPQYDADDLAALNIFGRTSISNGLVYSRKISPAFTLVPYFSYLYNLPDEVDQRVPQNSNDTLPDLSTKRTVSRKLGDTLTLGGGVMYSHSDELSFGTAYEYANKAEDSYSGNGPGVYSMLSQFTATQGHKIKAEVTYSTVKAYFRKAFLLPMVVSLEISDVIAGVNVERQLAQEVNLMLFF